MRPLSTPRWSPLRVALVLVVLFGGILVASSPAIVVSVGASNESAPAEPGRELVVAAGVPTYPVTFTESALPASSNWSVSILGETWNSTAASLVLLEPNGSYAFTSHSDVAPGNWTADGSFDVAGSPVSVPVSLVSSSLPTAGPSASATGGSIGWIGPILGVVLGLVVAVAALLGLTRRQRGRPTAPSRESTATPLPQPHDAHDRRPSEAEEPDPLGHML